MSTLSRKLMRPRTSSGRVILETPKTMAVIGVEGARALGFAPPPEGPLDGVANSKPSRTGYDGVVVAVAHFTFHAAETDEFRRMSTVAMSPAVIVDLKRVFERKLVESWGAKNWRL